MKRIEDIKNEAIGIGACCRVEDMTDYPHLAELFFSAQGREFCERKNFPSIEHFRAIKADVKPHNIFVDAGDIYIANTHKIALIGSTHATIKARGVKAVHLIMLMHGATAVIDAAEYAVIKVVNISGGDVTINNDITTRIL